MGRCAARLTHGVTIREDVDRLRATVGPMAEVNLGGTAIGTGGAAPSGYPAAVVAELVNPVIPEMVNQVAYQVIGNDVTITFAAEAGQLQLNAFEPVMAFNLLQSINLLRNAAEIFRLRCVDGIEGRDLA